MNRLVMLEAPDIPVRRPKTPPKPIDTSVATPQKTRDIYTLLRSVEQAQSDPTASRLIIRKVVKSFEQKIFKLGAQGLDIQKLEARVEQLRPRKRSKVKLEDPNERFITIEDIMRTKEETAKEAEARERRLAELTERILVTDTSGYRYEDMCLEWQLN